MRLFFLIAQLLCIYLIAYPIAMVGFVIAFIGASLIIFAKWIGYNS